MAYFGGGPSHGHRPDLSALCPKVCDRGTMSPERHWPSWRPVQRWKRDDSTVELP
jgi:hypothetical protein